MQPQWAHRRGEVRGSGKKGHIPTLPSQTGDPGSGYYENSTERARAFVGSIRPSSSDVQLLSIFRRDAKFMLLFWSLELFEDLS